MSDAMVNEWTRDDLPSATALRERLNPDVRPDVLPSDFRPVLDAVVEHLNAHHPKPHPEDATPKVVWRERALEAERYLMEARRERDAVVERAEIAEDQWQKWEHKAERVERERDEAVSRAEAAEQERDEWESLYLKATFRGVTPIARAEAAESRTAPAVTKSEIEKVVWDWSNTDIPGLFATDLRLLTDSLDALVSGDDPVVHVVRESDVETHVALRNESGEFIVNGTVLNVTTAEDCREKAQRHLDAAARCESIARAIEAEQATDPVEELAEQIESATRAAIRQVCDDLADVAPSLDPLAVEQAMEITAASRKVAAHVLGQEECDE